MSNDLWRGWAGVFLAAQPGPNGSEVWEGWGSVVLVAGSSLVGLAIVGLAIWQGFRTWQTKMTTRLVLAQDEAYRKLAEQATAAQQTTAEEQRKVAAELSEIRVRVTAIEALLREVG